MISFVILIIIIILVILFVKKKNSNSKGTHQTKTFQSANTPNPSKKKNLQYLQQNPQLKNQEKTNLLVSHKDQSKNNDQVLRVMTGETKKQKADHSKIKDLGGNKKNPLNGSLFSTLVETKSKNKLPSPSAHNEQIQYKIPQEETRKNNLKQYSL